MTEIVFRSNGAVEMTLSTNNGDPARICGLTSTAMSAFGCFGQVGDSIAVEESREGVIGRTPGGRLIKLCSGSFPSLDDPAVMERVTLYRAASADDMAALMEIKTLHGETALYRAVLEDLGIELKPEPSEERTDYWIGWMECIVVVGEEFLDEREYPPYQIIQPLEGVDVL